MAKTMLECRAAKVVYPRHGRASDIAGTVNDRLQCELPWLG